MSIPNLSAPFHATEIDGTGAGSDPSQKPTKVLCIGLTGAGGSAAAGEVKQILGERDGDSYWENGDQIAQETYGFRRVNKVTELYGVGIAEPAGAKSSGSFQFTGPATEDGVVPLYVSGKLIAVPVSATDTADDMAAAAEAELAATLDLPVTGAAATDTLTTTARHNGVYGDDIVLEVARRKGDKLPAGVGVTVTAMSGGSGVPDLSALAALVGQEYDTIVSGFADDASLDDLEDDQTAKWAPLVEQGGIVFFGIRGSASTIVTLTKAPARNSPYSAPIPPESPTNPTEPWLIAAQAAGLDHAEKYINTPRQGRVLRDVVAGGDDEFDLYTRSTIIDNGASTTRRDSSGRVVIDRLVTSYQENSLGAPDLAFKDVTRMRVLSFLRWSWRTYIQTKHPNSLLADSNEGIDPGVPVITTSTLKAEAIAWFKARRKQGLVEDLEAFREHLSTIRPTGDHQRLDTIMKPKLIKKFLRSGTTIQFE